MVHINHPRSLFSVAVFLSLSISCSLGVAASLVELKANPNQITLTRNNRQQLVVRAHYSDGRTRDITRSAKYESTNPHVVGVDANGLISSFNLTGTGGILIRFREKTQVVLVSVATGEKLPPSNFKAKNLVDEKTQKQWKELGFLPSELCSDEIFIRRVTLHLTGRLPTPKQIRSFTAAQDPAKRDKLVDALLSSPEYGIHFANYWANQLRIPSTSRPDRSYDSLVFYKWIFEQINDDRRFDEFAQELVSAKGDLRDSPPVVWYSQIPKTWQLMEESARLFGAKQVRCFRCHDHPYEEPKASDYQSLLNFFGRLKEKTVRAPREVTPDFRRRLPFYYSLPENPRDSSTREPIQMKLPGGQPVGVPPRDDPRNFFLEWVRGEKGIAQAVVNRYWAYFFQRGLVEPIDDIRPTNPASHPELLEALTDDFIENGYSLKHLARTICQSRTYQLSSKPNEYNRHDTRHFSRFYPRAMSREMFFDSICQMTSLPVKVKNLPRNFTLPNRSVLFREEMFRSEVPELPTDFALKEPCPYFHPPQKPNPEKRLELLATGELQRKISGSKSWAKDLLADPRPERAKVEDLFLWTLGRQPTIQQLNGTLSFLLAQDNQREAYERLVQALLGSKEFLYIN